MIALSVVLILAAAVIVVGSMGLSYTVRCNKLSSVVIPSTATVTAHTGCNGTKQNSLESIAVGVQNGAQIVEFDIRFLSDCTPVLAHDEDETVGAVTLFEAFTFASKYPDLRFNVDMKEVDYAENVAALIAEFDLLERAFFTGIEYKDVPTIKEKCPEIPFYLNVGIKKNRKKTVLDAIEKIQETGAIGANFGYKALSKEVVSLLREAGIAISVYTVDSKWALSYAMQYGVDNITSRRPDRVFYMKEKYIP